MNEIVRELIEAADEYVDGLSFNQASEAARLGRIRYEKARTAVLLTLATEGER